MRHQQEEGALNFVRVKDVNGREWYVNTSHVVAIEPRGTDQIVLSLSTGRDLRVITDDDPAEEARRLAEAMSD